MVIVDPKITAKTERLLLRPLAIEDAADINRTMFSNPEVMKHTSMQPSDDIERAKAWIQGCHDRANNWNFVIELLPTTTSDSHNPPRVIGLCGAVRAPECGYMLDADYWGKGYATEALQAFLPLFFDHFSGGDQGRFEYAEAFVDPGLISSQKVLKKAGFELVEVRKKDFENPTLGWRDTNVYRLYRPDSVDRGTTNIPYQA